MTTNKIIRIILCTILAFILVLSLSSCGYNKQLIDLNYNFNYAIIFLPDGDRIEGKVSTWNDYEQSDMIQVKINGIMYLTHSSNVILETR